MKPTLFLIALTICFTQSLAQSASFQALKDNFADESEVYSIKVGGFVCKAVLWMAAEDEEWKEAVSDISSIRVITIPKELFAEHKLSVGGFRKYLSKDHFESLVTVREQHEVVEFYLQESGNKIDRYFVLVEDSNAVTAIEIKGYIDIQKIKEIEEKKSLSYQEL